MLEDMGRGRHRHLRRAVPTSGVAALPTSRPVTDDAPDGGSADQTSLVVRLTGRPCGPLYGGENGFVPHPPGQSRADTYPWRAALDALPR
jgi:hypothetical protein